MLTSKPRRLNENIRLWVRKTNNSSDYYVGRLCHRYLKITLMLYLTIESGTRLEPK
jgi:hypothetical protein